MSKKSKSVIFLLMSILLVAIIAFAATYAYLSIREERKGTFDIKLKTKGVDLLKIESKKDAYFNVNSRNFSKLNGHDVGDDTIIDIYLSTSKNQVKYCYKAYLKLPDKKVFEYSVSGRPELVLTVQKSGNDGKYNDIIKNMDITTKTGIINIPIDSSNKMIHELSTGSGKEVKNSLRAIVTFKYFKDVYQAVNNDKTYSASFKVELVNCSDGTKYTPSES